jgi:hypothetical protein
MPSAQSGRLELVLTPTGSPRPPTHLPTLGPPKGPVCPTTSTVPKVTVTGPASLNADATRTKGISPGASSELTITVEDDVTGIGLSYACTTASGTSVGSGSLATGAITSGVVSNTLTNRFPVGATIITCTATDCNGQTQTSAPITVTVSDQTKPTINLAEGTTYTFEATSAAGYRFEYTVPSATDNVDDPVTAVCDPTPPGWVWAINDAGRVHTVACNATDSANNVATATFTIKVRVRP